MLFLLSTAILQKKKPKVLEPQTAQSSVQGQASHRLPYHTVVFLNVVTQSTCTETILIDEHTRTYGLGQG